MFSVFMDGDLDLDFSVKTLHNNIFWKSTLQK